MKNIFITLWIACSINAVAQSSTPSDISEVKVYRQTAEITRDAEVKLTTGKQEIILTGISTYINPASLQVKFNKSNCTLLSAKYERNYLVDKEVNPEMESMKAEMDNLQDALNVLVDEEKSFNGMKEILSKNMALGGTAGFSPAQVIELTDGYQVKMLEIRKELRSIRKNKEKHSLAISKLSNQLNSMNTRFNRPSGNIILQIEAPSVTTMKIRSVYTVSNAGWYPLYDLRSEGIENNVQLNYKANVYQSTGQDWKDVNMTISTGNTSQNNNRPILNPLYADISYPAYGYLSENKDKRRMKKAEAPMSSMKEVYEPSVVEDEVMDSGFRFEAQVGENQLNVEFSIRNKQSVLSDGKENMLALQSYDIHTDYIYHTVPKLNSGAFLLAKISDWGQYNLVPGEANIFFEGAFVGKTSIDPQVTSDTLLVSMGRDNSIIVERTPIEEFTATKFIGSNKKQTVGYEISVKNKKSTAIKIEIVDQIPVSTNSDIEITIVEKDAAEYSKKLGKLKWTSTIEPNKTIKRKFVYTAKYPKNESVYGIE